MTDLQEYRRFLAWQCRVRKQCVREFGGRPAAGMSAGIHSLRGGDEQARISFLINKAESQVVTAELRHIVRKIQDERDWLRNGLRILAERHYQDDFNFSDQLTALFGLDSAVADALTQAGACHLKFSQDSIGYAFDFDVAELNEDDDAYQATYWHNYLFNPALPGKVRVLGFTPRLQAAKA